MNASGTAALAWVAGGALRVATRAGPTSRWHISSHRFPAAARRPQVAVDASGDIELAYEHWDGLSLVLTTSLRPAHGQWQRGIPLSGDVGEGQGEWRLAMNPRGDAVLVWTQYRVEAFYGHSFDVYETVARTMSGASGAWGPAVQLSSPTASYAGAPDVALDRQGDALVAWRQYDESADGSTVKIANGTAAAAAGGWSVSATFPTTAPQFPEVGPRVATDDAGFSIVVWDRADRADADCGALVGVSLASHGAWSAPAPISRAGECPVEPQVAVDSHGVADAVWDSLGPRVSDLAASSSKGQGRWAKPTQIARIGALPPAFNDCLDACPLPPRGLACLADDRLGDSVIVWNEPEGGVFAVRGVEGALGDWGHPALLSKPASGSNGSAAGVTAAITPGGEALAAWTSGDLTLATLGP